jgi:ABC-type glycerol-3-phosphate transport system substrate-binding protein
MRDHRRRRRPAALLVATALAFGTAACGSGSGGAGSDDPNALEVWTRSNPDSAATYDRVFAAFTKKTGIKIDYQPVINFDQQLQSRASTTEVYVLTNGGPAGSTDVWMTRAYTLGFTRNDIGGASAASVVLLCVTLLLTVTINYLRKRGEAR